jgi:serine phosphatase RsbU (regulator of sigma subunit)
MKKIVWLILFLFTAKIISAQCDSEVKEADSEKSDTLRFRKYRRVQDCFYKTDDFDGASKLFEKQRALANILVKKYADSVYYRSYLADLTTLYFYKGDILKCLDISTELLNYDLRNSDSVDISASFGNIAILYRKIGNYPKSIYYLQEAIKINEASHRNELAGNYSNLANVYSDLGQHKKSGEFFYKALKLRLEQKDERGLALSYANLANYFSNMNKDDSAIVYYSKAIYMNEKLKAPDSKKALTYNNFTGEFIKKNQLDSAEKYLKIVEKLLNEKSNPFILSHFYENKGDVLKHQQKFKEAINEYNQSLKYAHINNDISRFVTLYYSKSECFYRLRNIDSTINNRMKAENFKDSLFNTSKSSQVTRYEMQYQFDKEQVAIKNEQIKKEIESKNALERKQILIYAACGGLFLLLVLVFFVLKSNNQKKKDNLLLQQKNDLIESQKKDIIDSINYAKNLQQAILPSFSKIKEVFGNCFIYYKPKDIIAGDFYWLYKSKQNDVCLFAVADCTGHGVPGALVSVVCSNALDNAVKKYNLSDPGLILDKTKELVLETFSKTGQNVKDGMDISLCSIQHVGNSVDVKWAGANNSLWYIHKGEIKELTANKQPIGQSENSQPFTTQTLKLERGDTLYFSTDGYYDQFGGDKGTANGKKFMRKRLSQLFFEMKDQTMQGQMDLVDKTFNNWKGKLEQIDDVCIAGIKL